MIIEDHKWVDIGTPILKIVNDLFCGLIFSLSPVESEKIVLGRSYDAYIYTPGIERRAISLYIDKEVAITSEGDTYFYGEIHGGDMTFLNVRKTELEIVISRHRGLSIPTKALIEKDDQIGVYVFREKR